MGSVSGFKKSHTKILCRHGQERSIARKSIPPLTPYFTVDLAIFVRQNHFAEVAIFLIPLETVQHICPTLKEGGAGGKSWKQSDVTS